MPTERIRMTFNNVGTTWVEQEIDGVPARFYITRVRAEISSGIGTQVALSIREQSDPDSALDVPLQYGLTDNPLDSAENEFAQANRTSNRTLNTGKMWVAVRCDAGTNTIEVALTLVED